MKVKVEKTTNGYSAYFNYKEHLITAVADTYSELKKSMTDAVMFAAEDYENPEKQKLLALKLEFILDIPAFFDLFPTINQSGFAKFLGINGSLLRQYAKGLKEPSAKRSEEILQGVRRLGMLYSEVQF